MSAPFFVTGSGKLNVTAAGAKELLKAVGRPSCPWNASGLKPNSKLRGTLEQSVKDLQKQCGFANVTPTNHHIFPGSSITTMLTGALKQHSNSIDLVNKYINSRKGIYNYLLDMFNRNEQAEALNEVYASVFWHEFNLVLGPTNRNNEPGSNIDFEVLGVQSQAVKKQFKSIDDAFKKADHYAALEIFLKTRDMFNGRWVVASNNKWNLFPANPVIKPATVGFAYSYEVWPWP